jgi:hypothetical protein
MGECLHPKIGRFQHCCSAFGCMVEMRRRDFTGFVGGMIAWPLVARAQEATRLHRILWVSTQSQPDPLLDGFREGMRALDTLRERILFSSFAMHMAIPQLCSRSCLN